MDKSIQSRGGKSTFQKYGRDYMRLIGSHGGLVTAKKYGRNHMAAIGRNGARVLYERYQLAPYELNKFALVDRITGEIKAVRV